VSLGEEKKLYFWEKKIEIPFFQVEETIFPYVSAMADFREQVRQEARALKATNILQYCDTVRDDVLPNLGVRLEDREGAAPAVKLVDRDTLMKEREQKLKVFPFFRWSGQSLDHFFDSTT
jgi:hypothetical protein